MATSLPLPSVSVEALALADEARKVTGRWVCLRAAWRGRSGTSLR